MQTRALLKSVHLVRFLSINFKLYRAHSWQTYGIFATNNFCQNEHKKKRAEKSALWKVQVYTCICIYTVSCTSIPNAVSTQQRSRPLSSLQALPPPSNLQTSKLETMSLDFVVTFVRMCSFDLLCHPYHPCQSMLLAASAACCMA